MQCNRLQCQRGREPTFAQKCASPFSKALITAKNCRTSRGARFGVAGQEFLTAGTDSGVRCASPTGRAGPVFLAPLDICEYVRNSDASRADCYCFFASGLERI